MADLDAAAAEAGQCIADLLNRDHHANRTDPTVRLLGILEWLVARCRELEAVIAKHDLCHDLHGKVGRDEFEEGCRRETVKEFGSCGWADRIAELEEDRRLLRFWIDALNGKNPGEVERLCGELREIGHKMHGAERDPNCPICFAERISELEAERDRLRRIIGVQEGERIVEAGEGWYLSDRKGGDRVKVTLTGDELRELERLRVENARLKAANGHLQQELVMRPER